MDKQALINSYKSFQERFYKDTLFQTDFKDIDPLTNFDDEVESEACYALDLVYAGYIARETYPEGGLWEVYARLLQLERLGYIGDPKEGLMYVNNPQAVLRFVAPDLLKFEGFGASDSEPTSILSISKYTYKNSRGYTFGHFVLGHESFTSQGLNLIDTIRGGSRSVAVGTLNSLRQISVL